MTADDNGRDEVSDNVVDDDAAADAVFPEQEPAMEVRSPKHSRTATAVAMLSLLLSVAALLGVGWLWITQPAPTPAPVAQDNSQLNELAAAVRASETGLAQLRQNLGALGDQDAASKRRLEQFQSQFERQLGLYESLPGRMQNLEGTMSSIQGISAGVRDNWLLAEAEYYMQIANAQLQLAGNPHLARLALLQADERIQQLANPALTNVRRELASELRALEVMDRPDIEGVTLTLASLASVVDSLPLRSDVETPTDPARTDNEDLTGLDRAVQSLKDTMSGTFSVRRIDEDIRPLIAPEAAYFLRSNLALQLQTARLALLRAERAVFQQSLDDSADWIDEFYDTQSTQVQGALQTIAEIRESLFDIEVPDVSQSLRLLRQYNQLAGAAAGRDSTALDAAATEQNPVADELPVAVEPLTDDDTADQ